MRKGKKGERKCYLGKGSGYGSLASQTEPRKAAMNGNRAAKDADCFYLIHFDRPIDGYWAAGFWGDELEAAGPAPPAPFVAAVGIAEE